MNKKKEEGDRGMLKKIGVSILICFLCTGCFSKKEEDTKTGYDQVAINTLLLKYVNSIEQEIALAQIEGNGVSYDGTYFLKNGILTNENGVTLDVSIKSTKEDTVVFKIEDYKVTYAELTLYTSTAIYENGKLKNT